MNLKILDLLYIFIRNLFTVAEERPPKNSTVFKNITQVNQSSLSKYLPISYGILKKKLGSNAPGYIVYCQRMTKHAKKANDAANWYFLN